MNTDYNNKNEFLKILNLDSDTIDSFSIDLDTNINRYICNISFKRTVSSCPHCGAMHPTVKERKNKKLIGNPINNIPSIYNLHYRRYTCRHCRKSSYDDIPIIVEGTNVSLPALLSLLEDFKHYTALYSTISRKYGISPSEAMNQFDKYIQVKRFALPRVLSIDEVYFNRHAKRKYICVLMDFEQNVICDVLESRWMDYLDKYFSSIKIAGERSLIKETEKVEYFVSDMYEPYRQIHHKFFKHSTHLVDHFHVVKLINDYLNSTRKKIMRKYAKDKKCLEYRLLKYRYKVLLKDRKDINYVDLNYDKTLGYICTEQTVLEEVLKIDDNLRKFYHLKERYLNFSNISQDSKKVLTVKEDLDALIDDFNKSDIEEAIKVAKALRNWNQEILNSFAWIDGNRINNRRIEGKNNYIKKILSNANGMSNFNRARNRIMFTENLHNEYSTGFDDHYIVEKITKERSRKNVIIDVKQRNRKEQNIQTLRKVRHLSDLLTPKS